MSTLEVNNITPQSGTSITIGGSGDTVSLGSGATQSGFGGTNTPAFRAGLSSAQSISNGTYTTIIFNSEQYDTNNAYNTSNGRFTVPSGESGKYFFYGHYRYQTASSFNSNIEIHKNGSQVAHFGGGTKSNYPSNSISYSADLSVGDYIEVKAWQESGGSLDLTGNIAYTSFFGMKLIGA